MYDQVFFQDGQRFTDLSKQLTVWHDLLQEDDWRAIVEILDLSPGQADFLWNALEDPRDSAIASRMHLSRHGAHAHRRAVFRKLNVDSMSGAIARVFAAYLQVIRTRGAIDLPERVPTRIRGADSGRLST
jgi:hypothetical protein